METFANELALNSKEERREKNRERKRLVRSTPEGRALNKAKCQQARDRKRKLANQKVSAATDPIEHQVQKKAKLQAGSNDAESLNVLLYSGPSSSSASPNLNDYASHTKWMKVQEKFFKNIEDGPTHRCMCCDRLWMQKNLTKRSKSDLRNNGFTEDQIQIIFSRDKEVGEFCKTCTYNIRNKSIPQLAANYGFRYPEQPACLAALNDLEERLVALRIPFMQIRTLGRDRQLGIHGSVTNVPLEMQKSIGSLPRDLNDSETIFVKLKKRLSMKSHFMYQAVDPNRVFTAANYLLNTKLYQSQDIKVDGNWLEKFRTESFPEGSNHVADLNVDDESDSDDEDANAPPIQTVIQKTNANVESGLALAPGEDKMPLSVLFDDLAEELSYPKIYCGEVRQFNRPKPPSYVDIIKSEIRRYDRRGATPQKILYSHQKKMHRDLLSSIQIQLRNMVPTTTDLTAENIQDTSCLRQLVQTKSAYKFLRPIKCSPAHWGQEKGRVCAQIRQFGFPTLFLTLSANENHWYDLVKHLVKIHKNHDLTPEEFKTMKSVERNNLICNDPVICCIYFKHKVDELFKILKVNYNEGPLAGYKITHFYQRTEFQQRGSPHFHILLWLEGAPVYGEASPEEMCQFVQKIMTCSKNNQYADLQRHKHTFTCTKNAKKDQDTHCRFNIPFFPSDETRLLEPVPEQDKTHFNRIRDYLAVLEEVKPTTMTFADFLNNLQMSSNEYFAAIQAGINRPTILLKRNVDEIMINNYNPKILNMMGSNMDLQLILDGYAVVAYLVDYISKPARGLTKQLRKCVEVTQSGNTNLKDRLTKISNAFINATEISAQEAAWSLLELPMSQLSEDTVFIMTFPFEERSRMVKSREKLQKLDPNSTDIFEKNLLDRYTQRPDNYESMSLADFAAWMESSLNGEPLKNGKGFVRKRQKPKIIQYRKYQENVQPDQYYREQIMLFLPWRDEQQDILSHAFKPWYEANLDQIKSVRKHYVFNEEFDIEMEVNNLEIKQIENENNEDGDPAALLENELEYDEEEMKVDIGLDMNAAHGKDFTVFQAPERVSVKEFKNIMCNLNTMQRDLVLEMKYRLTRYNDQIDIFVQGAAGTGKSFLIKALHQMMVREFQNVDQDPALKTVLLLAPTGKAASNIGGETLHSAFGLPLSFSAFMPLSSKALAEYACKFYHVKCIIIDEISMVGYSLYKCIDQRLREIKGVDKPLGGLHCMKFGDLRQLPPVKDAAIYKTPKSAGLSVFSENLWHRTQFYKLTEIMRQKDDQPYANLLNNMASGKMTDEEVTFIKSKQVQWKDVPKEATLLYYSNREVDLANVHRLNEISSDLQHCYSIDTVTGIGSVKAKSQLLNRCKTLPRSDTSNLSYVIQLKIGVKYMLTYNLNTGDKLVNGSVGFLRHVETCKLKNSDGIGIKRIWLEFMDGPKVGFDTRSSVHRYMIENKINHKWTPIERQVKTIHEKKNKSLSVTRKQFPVIVAEAMTIHKSQGCTFDSVAVGMTKGMSQSLQYVAFSRVTKASGLFVLNEYNRPAPPKEDDPMVVELQRLESIAPEPMFAFLHSQENCGYQFMYHNVQSLHAHYEDILADKSFMASDFMLFAETWSIMGDEYEFPDFQLGVETFSSLDRTRKHSGVAIYVKKQIPIVKRLSYPNYDKGIHVAVLYLERNVRLVVLYSKPGNSCDDILDALNMTIGFEHNDYKSILAGDFNINMSTEDGKQFCEVIREGYWLDLKTNPAHWTTRGKTTIDAVFASEDLKCCGVYESTFSYHIPLYGRL